MTCMEMTEEELDIDIGENAPLPWTQGHIYLMPFITHTIPNANSQEEGKIGKWLQEQLGWKHSALAILSQ